MSTVPGSNLRHVLVTGANGFVGREVCRQLLACGFAVTAAVRHIALFADTESLPFRQVVVGDLSAATDWTAALKDVDAVIHLAARVHVLHEKMVNPLTHYRAVNVAATTGLARAASVHGVRRLVFLSSIKVNGESTREKPFDELDAVSPHDSYAQSKWEAEQELLEHGISGNLEVTVLRPPLVYGPGVKANFFRLMQWVDKGIPLPLGSVHNCRSMIYIGNLVDALIACVEHPAATGKTYLVSDGVDVSTPTLIRLIAAAMDKPARLWPCPEVVLRTAAGLVGKSAEVDRLLGSLQVDSSRIRRELDWTPPCSVREGILQTVNWYKNR